MLVRAWYLPWVEEIEARLHLGTLRVVHEDGVHLAWVEVDSSHLPLHRKPLSALRE